MRKRAFEVADNCITELLDILHRNDDTLSGLDYETMQSAIYKLKNFIDISRIENETMQSAIYKLKNFIDIPRKENNPDE